MWLTWLPSYILSYFWIVISCFVIRGNRKCYRWLICPNCCTQYKKPSTVPFNGATCSIGNISFKQTYIQIQIGIHSSYKYKFQTNIQMNRNAGFFCRKGKWDNTQQAGQNHLAHLSFSYLIDGKHGGVCLHLMCSLVNAMSQCWMLQCIFYSVWCLMFVFVFIVGSFSYLVDGQYGRGLSLSWGNLESLSC